MAAEKRVTVCVGDIHGHIERLRGLWRNLERKLGAAEFATAVIVFLGDYNDRGHDTKAVLDFLVALPRRYPQQRHVFLCGNHDFAFAAFVGALPPPPPGFAYASTWPEFAHNADREGWWSGPGEEEIHLQGRRWAGKIKVEFNVVKGVKYQGSIYDARPTFESYGVAHGDRAGLIAAVPESHKEFLRNLVWVHEQEGDDTGDAETSYSKLIAVHAGLESSRPIDGQLKFLHDRDVTAPRIEPLAGRKNVWSTPPDLAAAGVLMVSGHHARLHLERNRLIVDESGGLDHLPIAAVVLPSREIVRDTDQIPLPAAQVEAPPPPPVRAAAQQ